MHSIEVVADVRSNPYSRYATHFTGEFLKQELKKRNFKYVFLGHEIGGKPKENEFYDSEGFVDYAKLAASSKFLGGMERLQKGIKSFRVAVMCGEEDPSGCHRHLLISKFASESGIDVLHIRKHGDLQTYLELVLANHVDEPPTQLNLFLANADSERETSAEKSQAQWRSQAKIRESE